MRKSSKSSTVSEKMNDPPEIGPADVASAPAAKPKKSAPLAYLDAVNSYLKQLAGEEERAEAIILDVFGDSDQAMPARMLAFLRDAKADGRFVIEKRGDKTFVSLASAQNPAAESPAPAAPVAETKEVTVEHEKGGKTTREIPMRAGSPMPTASHDPRFRCLQRHQEKGRHLSREYFVLQDQEMRDAEALKSLRKTIETVALALAEHARADPYQTELAFAGGDQ